MRDRQRAGILGRVGDGGDGAVVVAVVAATVAEMKVGVGVLRVVGRRHAVAVAAGMGVWM